MTKREIAIVIEYNSIRSVILLVNEKFSGVFIEIFSYRSTSISRGPMSISNASLIKSDAMPVLNILDILTTLEE